MSMAGIQPGLERIAALLKGVSFPWQSIHVAGTNGKGSICHYASSMLVGHGVKVGKFTSPHLVDRWDCISINGKPVDEAHFLKIERHYQSVNSRCNIGASPFEILTATAFTVFTERNVHVGVVEVGMGGKLDSTNILNNQAVSVISKIARDHEAFLGTTLSEIASHKAGILRPSVPYIVNSSNEPNVLAVVQEYAQEISAGPQLTTSSFNLGLKLYDKSRWTRATSLLLPFQIENLKMAVVAAVQMLESMGREAKPADLAKTLISNAKMRIPGRQELVRATPIFQNAGIRRNQILVDGAHNPDAAVTLDAIVNSTMRYGTTPAKERPASGWPVTWVLAMTEGKDAREYLATLLKPGDNVVTTSFGPVAGMPWVKPMHPKELLEVAKSVEPHITGVHVPLLSPLRAISAAKYLSNQSAAWSPIVLTGSLYLVGDLHRELRPRSDQTWWTDTDPAVAADRELYMKMQAEERERVGAVLGSKKEAITGECETPAAEEERKLQEELDDVNRQVEVLDIEEKRIIEEHSVMVHGAYDQRPLSDAERLGREDEEFLRAHATPEELAIHLARAERLRESLAIGREKAAIAAKERAEKLAARRARREKRELRRERKLEKRSLEKEEALQRKALQREMFRYSAPPITTVQQKTSRGGGEEEEEEEEEDDHAIRNLKQSERFSINRKAARSAPASNTGDKDALSVLGFNDLSAGQVQKRRERERETTNTIVRRVGT